jgi:hypothetical protein
VQPNPHTNWVLILRGVRTRVRRVLPSLFLAPTTIKRKQLSNPPKLTTYPTQSHLSTPRESLGKKPLSQKRKLLFAYFVAMLVTWMSFASVIRELRRGTLIMLETHIAMSLLISLLVLILVLHLISFIDLTIAHMVLVHERTTLCLDALVMADVLIVVIVSRVGMVFLREGLTLTLNPDTCMVHVFSVVVHVPLVQMVKCKRL